VLLHRFGEEQHAAVVAEGIRSGKIHAKIWPRFHLALSRAGRYPEPVREALTERIAVEPNPTVLAQMVWHLGRARHRPAADPLRKLFEHPDPKVAAAAFAAHLQIPGAATTESLLPLLEAKAPALRLRAAEALRRLDDASGLPAVTGVRETARSALDRLEAVRILSTYRRSAAVAPLVDALLDADARVRARAGQALTNLLATLFPYRSFQLASAGYDPKKPPAANTAAVERIRAWWGKARTRDW